MVKIVDFKSFEKEDGTEFHALVVQGGLEAVKSKETQRTYFTARTARVACTFNETMCQSLIGTDLPGSIHKVEVEPYEYAIPDTGEMVSLSHRNEYVGEEERIVKDNVIEKEVVI